MPSLNLGITLNLTVADPADPTDAGRRSTPPAASTASSTAGFLDPIFRGAYPADFARGCRATVGFEAAVHPGDLETISQPIDTLGVNYYHGEFVERAPAARRDCRRRAPTERAEAVAVPAGRESHWHPRGLPRHRDGLGGAARGAHPPAPARPDEYTARGGPLYVTENGAAYDDESAVVETARRALKFGTAARNTEYAFEYLTNSGQVMHGLVELSGSNATNNLVVTVDPSTGEATLTNDSTYTVGLLGYSITSGSGSLLPADGSWNSLADQGFANLEEANPSDTNLSELVPFAGNALVIAPGQVFTLGTLFSGAGAEDLQFQFYLTSNPLQGDFNADGTVDGFDLTAWSAGYGSAYSGRDLLLWQRNFGRTEPTAVPIIMHGVVKYQSIVAAVTSVPEPTSVTLLATAFAIQFGGLGRRRRSYVLTTVSPEGDILTSASF